MGDNLLDTLAEHISHSNPIIQYKLQNILYTRSTKCGRNSKEKERKFYIECIQLMYHYIRDIILISLLHHHHLPMR